MSTMFFSQRVLTALIDAGKIKLDQNILTILANDTSSYELKPAFRFVKTANNVPDPHKLVGRIKYEQDIKSMNAEIYLDSIIYQDIAYEVEPGFMGELKELPDTLSDSDLLAQFLLKNM